MPSAYFSAERALCSFLNHIMEIWFYRGLYIIERPISIHSYLALWSNEYLDRTLIVKAAIISKY